MKQLIFIAILGLVCVGCSKDGANSRLMEGPTSTDVQQSPTPTDVNFPELGPKVPGQ